MSRKVSTVNLLTASTTTATGDAHEPWGDTRTYGATGTTSAGAGSATILIEVRNDPNAAWITMGTITLTLSTTATADGFSSIVPWRYVRARISAISGTTATVTVTMGNLA